MDESPRRARVVGPPRPPAAQPPRPARFADERRTPFRKSSGGSAWVVVLVVGAVAAAGTLGLCVITAAVGVIASQDAASVPTTPTTPPPNWQFDAGQRPWLPPPPPAPWVPPLPGGPPVQPFPVPPVAPAPKKPSRLVLPHAPYDAAVTEAAFASILSEQYPQPKLLRGKVSSYLKFISTTGDYIGQGERRSYNLDELRVTPTLRYGGVEVSVDGWGVEMAPPRGTAGFPPGKYRGATRAAFRTGAEPGVNFAGHGRCCNTVKGSFALWELEIEDGQVVALAADFLHRSEGTGPPLYGRVRYNSKFE